LFRDRSTDRRKNHRTKRAREPLARAEKGHATALRDGVNKSSQQLSVSHVVKGMLDA
jgi:hypothetical protein